MLSSKLRCNCAIDTLGPVYPGQIPQVKLFPTCLGTLAIYPVVFAETHNNHLPSTVCKIAHQTELLFLLILLQQSTILLFQTTLICVNYF